MTARPHIDDAERRRRLIVRHHLGRDAADVLAATRDSLALHSSDPVTPYLACWARVPGVTVADLEDALYRTRALWRLHSIRRTLWVVPAQQGPKWLGAATVALAQKDRRSLEKFIAQSDLPAAVLADPGAWLDHLEGQILTALHDAHEPLPTRDLGERVPELTTKIIVGSGKWVQEQSVSSRLLYLMAMHGVIVRAEPLGSWRASQYRWALTHDWFDGTAATSLPRPEEPARADLLGDYLARFGPVTLDDIRWWSGWTKARSVRALERAHAVEVDLDGGQAGWVLPGDEGPTAAPQAPAITLLPGLDPTLMGWTVRQWYLGAHTTFGGPLFDRNGNVGPTIVVDGRAVGAWAQRPDGEVVTALIDDVGAEATGGVDAAAAELQAWLGADVITPRFPTPLEKQLRTS